MRVLFSKNKESTNRIERVIHKVIKKGNQNSNPKSNPEELGLIQKMYP